MPYIIGLIVVVVIVVVMCVNAYNRLIHERENVKSSWAQIDVILKQRADSVPNLVETVKGYAKHESETLEKVISARNKYVAAPSQEQAAIAGSEMVGALNRLFALSESYPDLKANTNFVEFQRQYQELESKLAKYRQFYNDSVMVYNRRRQSFPTVIIANMFGFGPETYFEVSEAKDREAPKVQF